jgi:hypothetical protein
VPPRLTPRPAPRRSRGFHPPGRPGPRRLAVAAGQRLPPPPEGAGLQLLAEAEGADGEPAALLLLLPDRAPPELLPEGVTLSAAALGYGGGSSIPMDRLQRSVPWPSRWGSYPFNYPHLGPAVSPCDGFVCGDFPRNPGLSRPDKVSDIRKMIWRYSGKPGLIVKWMRSHARISAECERRGLTASQCLRRVCDLWVIERFVSRIRQSTTVPYLVWCALNRLFVRFSNEWQA